MKDKKFAITVCASGGGGNFQALIDGQITGDYHINCLIVDRECGAIDRAVKHHIPCHTLLMKDMGKKDFWESFANKVPPSTDLIVLAGFIPIVPENICRQWDGKMINTHPSLLPKYGGKGMVGVKVQEAVIANGETEAGCTVHFVSPEIDGGAIILQSRIPVIQGESAWDLGGRVFAQENIILVSAIQMIKDRRSNAKVD